MMSLSLTFLLALLQTNEIGANWVVLDLKTGTQGNIQSVQVVQGGSPYIEIALETVRQWMFAMPGTGTRFPSETNVSAVFLYRPPDLFAGAPLRSPSLGPNADRPPVPLELADPGYPVNSVGQGVAMLELKVATSGAIEDVRVLIDTPGLTSYTEKAVRGWRFQPARRNGIAVSGTAIVVASYLRPIIYNNPPVTGAPYYPYNPNGNPGPAPEPPRFRDGGPAPRPF